MHIFISIYFYLLSTGISHPDLPAEMFRPGVSNSFMVQGPIKTQCEHKSVFYSAIVWAGRGGVYAYSYNLVYRTETNADGHQAIPSYLSQLFLHCSLREIKERMECTLTNKRVDP